MKPIAPRPRPEPEPVNPWDAVNALKVDIAAAAAGGAGDDVVAAMRQKLADLVAALPSEVT